MEKFDEIDNSEFAAFFDEATYATDAEVMDRKLYGDMALIEGAVVGETDPDTCYDRLGGVRKSRTEHCIRDQELFERRRAYMTRLRVDNVNVLSELARIAFFDIRNLFDDQGRPLPVQKLDEVTAAAISSIKVQQLGKADGFATVIEYKLNDKLKALDKLARYLGLFKEDNININVNGNVQIAEMSKTERARRLAFMIQEGLVASGLQSKMKEVNSA